MIDEDNWIDRNKCSPIPREQILVKYPDGKTEITWLSQNLSGRIIQGFTHWMPLNWIDI